MSSFCSVGPWCTLAQRFCSIDYVSFYKNILDGVHAQHTFYKHFWKVWFRTSYHQQCRRFEYPQKKNHIFLFSRLCITHYINQYICENIVLTQVGDENICNLSQLDGLCQLYIHFIKFKKNYIRWEFLLRALNSHHTLEAMQLTNCKRRKWQYHWHPTNTAETISCNFRETGRPTCFRATEKKFII